MEELQPKHGIRIQRGSDELTQDRQSAGERRGAAVPDGQPAAGLPDDLGLQERQPGGAGRSEHRISRTSLGRDLGGGDSGESLNVDLVGDVVELKAFELQRTRSRLWLKVCAC